MQINRATTGQQVLSLIRDRIVSGDIEPGTKLDETTLAADLGVSRTPLREALAGLERDGLLVHAPYRGRIVVEMDAQAVAQTFPILGALEGLAIRLAPAFAPALLNKLDELNSGLRRVSITDRRRHELDREWHQRLVANAGNSRLTELVARQRALVSRHDGGAERGMADVEGSTREHEEVTVALRKGDRNAAVQHIEAHWARGIQTVSRWREAARSSGTEKAQ